MKRWFSKAIAILVVAAMIPSGAMAYYYATVVTVVGIATFDAKFSESVTGGTPQPVSVTQEIQQTDNYNTSGTGSGQVNLIYAAQLTLAASATTIDLTSLTDPAGQAVDFARVRELIIQNPSTSAGFDVSVSGGVSNGVNFLPASGSGIMCRYGSVLRISDKFSTGASTGNYIDPTHKTIKFDPSSNTVTINIMILGGTAALLIFPFRLRRYRRVAA